MSGKSGSPLSISPEGSIDFEHEFGVFDKPPYREIKWNDIGEALETTIKTDFECKVITFVNMLLAQTDHDSFNIAFQSETTAGKSYIALQVAEFFPPDEVIKIAHASATAFFHDIGQFDEEAQAKVVDLEGKILIFMDAPDYRLLANLRPFLSHDEKELHIRITDKSQTHGLQTKHIIIRGFSAVIFCTTLLSADDQERSRLLFLSPSTEQSKLEKSILLYSHKESDPIAFKRELEENVKRNWLKRLVNAVRESGVRQVKIDPSIDAAAEFLKEHAKLNPKHQRDFARVISLIKGHALINFRNRERPEFGVLVANQTDVNAGLELYRMVSEANDVGISPWTLHVFKEAIGPALATGAISLRQFREAFFNRFGHSLKDRQLRNLVEELEDAGLIESEYEGREKRIFSPPHVAIVSSQGRERSD